MANEETTRRLPPPDKITRADARLKLVKACDVLADDLQRLYEAIRRADPKDVEALLEGNPFTAPGHTDIKAAVMMATKETMSWAARLHDSGRFDDLGTKRFPDEMNQHPSI